MVYSINKMDSVCIHSEISNLLIVGKQNKKKQIMKRMKYAQSGQKTKNMHAIKHLKQEITKKHHAEDTFVKNSQEHEHQDHVGHSENNRASESAGNSRQSSK